MVTGQINVELIGEMIGSREKIANGSLTTNGDVRNLTTYLQPVCSDPFFSLWRCHGVLLIGPSGVLVRKIILHVLQAPSPRSSGIVL